MINLDDIDMAELARRLAKTGAGLNPAINGTPIVLSGNVAPTGISAAPGSLYLYENGASSVPYINTSAANPGTTWTAITVP